MIQRIQTLYLFIAAVLVLIVNFFPVAHVHVGQGFYTLSSLGVEASGVEPFGGSSVWMWVGTAFNVLAFVLAGMALFGYKNRIAQMRRCIFAILAIVAYYIFLSVEVWSLNNLTGVFPDLSLWGECPLIAIIFIFLAGRAIKRDEDLVRSMDRIR